MTDEEKSIFDEAEVNEELSNEEQPELEDDSEDEWVPTISKESPKAREERRGVKKDMDGKLITVKEIFHTRPKTKDKDGNPVPPKKTESTGAKFYPGKLGIRFEEENLVEYYPNFHYFLNDKDKVSNVAKINREGDSAVSQIFRLVAGKIGKPHEEISDADVYEYMKGKKVKIKTDKGKYLGKDWFRNDIIDIEPFAKE